MNRNAVEVQAIIDRIEEKITSYRKALESEMSSVDDMLKSRAKLASMTTLKKEIEEMFDARE